MDRNKYSTGTPTPPCAEHTENGTCVDCTSSYIKSTLVGRFLGGAAAREHASRTRVATIETLFWKLVAVCDVQRLCVVGRRRRLEAARRRKGCPHLVVVQNIEASMLQ
jgi:hypothetical protein